MSKYLVDLTQELNAIRTTPYGKTMRPNLADAIEKLNKRHNALSETFDNLVIDAGNSNAEVVDARNDNISQPPVNHQTLGGRLDAMQQQISNTSNNVAPIIQEVEQARGPHNNLNDRLNGIDNKFNDYLPLTGGDITGDLEVNGNLTTGGHQVWHEGNLTPDVFPTPETVVKRNTSGNINSYNSINFHDKDAGNTVVGTHMGSVTLNPANRNLYHAYIAPGVYDNPINNYEIYTRRHFEMSVESQPDTVVRRDANGHIKNGMSHNVVSYRFMSPQANLLLGGNFTDGTYTGDVVFQTNMRPLTHNVQNIGGTNYRFGQCWVQAGIFNGSDERIKTDIENFDVQDCYDMVKNTKVKSYTLLMDDKTGMTNEEIATISAENRTKSAMRQIGIIAQEIAGYKCADYILVQDDPNDIYAINPYNLTSALMGALQVEISKREELEERVAKLEELIV